MNPKRINELIAESLGWDLDPAVAREWKSRGQWCIAPAGTPLYEFKLISKTVHLPKYTEDLNAMHEAENSLDAKDLQFTYAHNLYNLCVPKNIQPMRATALQRAEAYLRTIGKWEE